MKKILAAVITPAILGLGLVATTSAPASACGYTSCVDPVTEVKAPDNIKVGQKAKVKFSVAAAGNVKPTGTVKVKVTGKNGFKFVKTVAYTGGVIKIKSSKLNKPGKYNVVVKFDAPANSVFDDDKTKSTLQVG